jgi:glyoxylase-like metal-dependent hydrolase (beta-lactamase superfamily II)
MPEIKVLIVGNHHVGPEEGRVDLNSTVTLIKSNKNILVDTGSFKDEQELINALDKEGLSVDDIDLVVLTHLHLDHILNVHLFKNSKILCKFSPKYPGQTHFPQEGCIRRTEIIDGTEIADGVYTMLTPGHTWDSISVVVETEEGKVIISGDALAAEEYSNLDKKPFEVATFDMKLFDESRKKILAKADYVIPGHGKKFKVN